METLTPTPQLLNAVNRLKSGIAGALAGCRDPFDCGSACRSGIMACNDVLTTLAHEPYPVDHSLVAGIMDIMQALVWISCSNSGADYGDNAQHLADLSHEPSLAVLWQLSDA